MGRGSDDLEIECTYSVVEIRDAAKDMDIPLTLEEAEDFLREHEDGLLDSMNIAARTYIGNFLPKWLEKSKCKYCGVRDMDLRNAGYPSCCQKATAHYVKGLEEHIKEIEK